MKPEIAAHEMLMQFAKIATKFKILESRPEDYGTGEPLFASEIMLIKTIHNHPDKNISELAQIKSLTKGAISQTANKLVKRGFIKKYRFEDNKKEVFLKLTDKGQIAYDAATEHFKPIMEELAKLYEENPQESWIFQKELFDKIEELLDKSL